MNFIAPQGSESFVQGVQSRTHHLIDARIWDISPDRFIGWFGQFVSSDEKFFGACLLDSLIYRSRQQFLACASSLYRGRLRWQCGAKVAGKFDTDLLEFLKSPLDLKIRLVPVIGDDDPPTKSGPLVLRYIKRELGLDEEWMVWPWKVQQLVDNGEADLFIFVDDFLGSGAQFSSFISSHAIPVTNTSTRWIYAPIVAHRQGIDAVKTAYPRMEIVASEYLDSSHGFFSDDSWGRLTNGAINGKDALDFYNEFLKRHGIDLQGNRHVGYDGLELCFGFAHSTPDNTLPILWIDNRTWSGLLVR